MCVMTVALISPLLVIVAVDATRKWFKARSGWSTFEAPRVTARIGESFLGGTIEGELDGFTHASHSPFDHEMGLQVVRSLPLKDGAQRLGEGAGAVTKNRDRAPQLIVSTLHIDGDRLIGGANVDMDHRQVVAEPVVDLPRDVVPLADRREGFDGVGLRDISMRGGKRVP